MYSSQKPPATAGKVIFVSMPTKGSTYASSAETGLLNEDVYKAMAKLHEKYPDHTFIAPMVQDYLLLRYLSKAPTWDNWGNHCKRLIEKSDEVWVLLMSGWMKPSYTMCESYNTSKGVFGEIQHAYDHSITVAFVDPKGL